MSNFFRILGRKNYSNWFIFDWVIQENRCKTRIEETAHVILYGPIKFMQEFK